MSRCISVSNTIILSFHTYTVRDPVQSIIPLFLKHPVAYLVLPTQRLRFFFLSNDSGLKYCPYKCYSLYTPKEKIQAVSDQGVYVAPELNLPLTSTFQEMFPY
jgi:hypothetical protein